MRGAKGWFFQDDVIVVGGADQTTSPRVVERLGLVATSGPFLAATTETTLLHVAHNLLMQGNAGAALEALRRGGTALDEDTGAQLLRMRIAQARNERGDAAGWALRAMGGGGLADADAAECLAAVRAQHPLVREALRLPTTGRLDFMAVAEPGVIVSAPRTRGSGRSSRFVTDTRTKVTTRVDVPELRDSSPPFERYRGRILTGAETVPNGVRLLRVDLVTGERTRGRDVFRTLGRPLRSMGAAAVADDALVVFDPESLEAGRRIALAKEWLPLCWDAEGVAVFSACFSFGSAFAEPEASGTVPLVAVDTRTGEEPLRVDLPFAGERLEMAAADRRAVYVLRSGSDLKASATGRGRWFSVEALDRGDGRRLWKYERDGFLAGQVLVEGDRLTFPAHQGKVSFAPITDQSALDTLNASFLRRKKKTGAAAPDPAWYIFEDCLFPLSRISLSLATGEVAAAEPLPSEKPCFHQQRPLSESAAADLSSALRAASPPGPRYTFPGTLVSVADIKHDFRRHSDESGWWLPSPASPPVPFLRAGADGGWHLVVRGDFAEADYWTWTALVEGDRVYESIGGGYVLVKDFAGGAGLEDVSPPPREKSSGGARTRAGAVRF